MKIILPGNPISTQHLYGRRGHMTYMTKEGKCLKEQYQWAAKSQWKGDPTDKKVKIEIKLYFKNNLRRDWDNWHKLSCDSLTGIVWVDDSQVYCATVEKFIDKENPRIEFVIEIL